MDYRGLVVVGAVVSAAVLPLLPACTAPDPGQITFVPRAGASNPADENGDQSSSGNTVSDAGTTTSSSSSSGGGADAGDPIFGTVAFAYVDPGEKANDQPAPHAPPMQGQACGQGGCHGAPTPAGPQWVAAGTIFKDAQGTALDAPAQFEIQIVDPKTNTAIVGPAFTDSDGNFWIDPGGAAVPIPDGALVGVRGASGKTTVMSPALSAATGFNCNSATGCHGAAGMKLYVP